MALGPTGAAPALKAVEQLGMTGKVHIATFDLSPDVLAAIKAGTMDFAIDQQQFLQGYLPIVILTCTTCTACSPAAAPPIYTGPGFVTKDNVDLVIGQRGHHPLAAHRRRGRRRWVGRPASYAIRRTSRG